MRILISIANYGLDNLKHLKTQLKSFWSMPFDITIFIDSTVEFDVTEFLPKLKINFRYFDSSIKQNLVFQHRELMIANKDKYDLYIYTENDILITEQNILSYLEITHKIPENYITGFIRYELKENDSNKYLIDHNPYHFPMFYKRMLRINDMNYFQLNNLHQGCFILTNEQLNRVIYSGNFTLTPHEAKKAKSWYGILECGASDVFINCGFEQKIFPSSEDLDNLMVHHLPNKYIYITSYPISFDPFTLNDLKLMVKNGIPFFKQILYTSRWYFDNTKKIIKKNFNRLKAKFMKSK